MSTPPFWGVFWALEVPYFGTSKRALLPLSELGVFYQYDGEYTCLVWSTDKLDANLKGEST